MLISRYNINKKITLAARGEYYNDRNKVIILTNTANGFQTFGYSLNIDYKPVNNMVIRLEGKRYDSKDKIFIEGLLLSNKNYCITSSIALQQSSSCLINGSGL